MSQLRRRAVPVGGSVSGVIDVNGDADCYSVDLVAGQTYMFSLRGTGATPINDRFFSSIEPAFDASSRLDDDGGNGLYSIITSRRPRPAPIHLAPDVHQSGRSRTSAATRSTFAQQGADAVGDTNATAVAIDLGTTFGFRETGTGGTPIDPLLAGDVDRYAVELEAGQFYTFKLAGGADYATNPQAVPPGELDTFLILRDAAGNIVALNDDNSFPSDISSSIGFFAETSGTYYIDATAYAGQTGGYALDLRAGRPQRPAIRSNALELGQRQQHRRPSTSAACRRLTSISAPPGENFGETDDDGVGPMATYGWNQHRDRRGDARARAVRADHSASITSITTDVEPGDVPPVDHDVGQQFGAYFYPQDPAYGTQQGIGAFNVDSGGLGSGFPAKPAYYRAASPSASSCTNSAMPMASPTRTTPAAVPRSCSA